MLKILQFMICEGRCRTHMGKLGINRFVAERCLIIEYQTWRVYDAGDYFEGGAQIALGMWADFLESCDQTGMSYFSRAIAHTIMNQTEAPIDAVTSRKTITPNE